VTNLADARHFFTGMLGCTEGRSAPRWVDFDFFGHQISAHVHEEPDNVRATNAVDGDAVPVRHFGLILEWQQWEELARRLKQNGAEFIIEPKTRFVGQPGEQGTMFVRGPSGNALEFKTFRDFGDIFST
jgi:hypothetical protein